MRVADDKLRARLRGGDLHRRAVRLARLPRRRAPHEGALRAEPVRHWPPLPHGRHGPVAPRPTGTNRPAGRGPRRPPAEHPRRARGAGGGRGRPGTGGGRPRGRRRGRRAGELRAHVRLRRGHRGRPPRGRGGARAHPPAGAHAADGDAPARLVATARQRQVRPLGPRQRGRGGAARRGGGGRGLLGPDEEGLAPGAARLAGDVRDPRGGHSGCDALSLVLRALC
mmetsp:Transcript_28887/g.89949  ORF Transcript_28887/g.89949 Transcript_28887/m.89949 type:complete len:225 (-) Transcript_28887:45-719(-)